MNHKAGIQRLRTNVIERDIDYSCVQYIYTTVYRTSDESYSGTQRLRTNVIERDIDYSCMQYIYTTVYRTSDDS